MTGDVRAVSTAMPNLLSMGAAITLTGITQFADPVSNAMCVLRGCRLFRLMAIAALLFERTMCRRSYLNMVVAVGKTENRNGIEAEKYYDKQRKRSDVFSVKPHCVNIIPLFLQVRCEIRHKFVS